jgi:6-pyruvoyltetrahydropterin/6-carboxytetrahydropterin synthase
MYSVTKRIDFCYGHRLLDHDGVCRHLHGHNAAVEIDVRSAQLDGRTMVCDFSDIKRIIKAWIDEQIDHKMVLRRDDPLVQILRAQGEPLFLVDANPTAEHLARIIYDYTKSQGFPVAAVRLWETPTSCAAYGGE